MSDLWNRRTAMTEAELKAAADRLAAIKQTRQELKVARQKLALFNKHGLGKTWTVNIEVRPATSHYSYDRLEQRVVIPAGVIQQQMIYECGRLRRKLISLGGEDR